MFLGLGKFIGYSQVSQSFVLEQVCLAQCPADAAIDGQRVLGSSLDFADGPFPILS
jgi:hypothetical protein